MVNEGTTGTVGRNPIRMSRFHKALSIANSHPCVQLYIKTLLFFVKELINNMGNMHNKVQWVV